MALLLTVRTVFLLFFRHRSSALHTDCTADPRKFFITFFAASEFTLFQNNITVKAPGRIDQIQQLCKTKILFFQNRFPVSPLKRSVPSLKNQTLSIPNDSCITKIRRKYLPKANRSFLQEMYIFSAPWYFQSSVQRHCHPPPE